VKKTLLDVCIEAEPARLEGRLDHAVAGVEVVPVQAERLHRAVASCGVPGVGQEHAANVKKECRGFFHSIVLVRGKHESRWAAVGSRAMRRKLRRYRSYNGKRDLAATARSFRTVDKVHGARGGWVLTE
jgi:hypothetical protein